MSDSKPNKEVCPVDKPVYSVSFPSSRIEASSIPGDKNIFSTADLLINILTIVLFLVDYGSDIWVIVLLHGDEGWSTFTILTILLVFLPLTAVNILSAVWYHQDHHASESGFCPVRSRFEVWERSILSFSHLFYLGPVVRQAHIIWCGVRETRPRGDSYRKLRLYYERDAAYLSLIDSFLQDSPQLLLQSYILLTRDSQELSNPLTAVIQVGSVLLSLCSISFGIVSHVSASHSADPSLYPLSLSASIILWFWRMGVLTSRMLTFSLFLSLYKFEFIWFLILHTFLMFVWIRRTGSNFCGSPDNIKRPVAELFYDIILAVIFNFDIINIKDGPTRWSNFWFYLLYLVELLVLLGVWVHGVHSTPNLPTWTYSKYYQAACISLVMVLYCVGISSIYVYYTRFHKDRKSRTLQAVAFQQS